MGSVNIRVVRNELKRSINSLQNLARFNAERKFVRIHRDLMNSFRSHLVTQEVRSGPNAPNITNTLDNYGNLFSFIGFPEGDDPLDLVEQALQTQIRLGERARISSAGDVVLFAFDVEMPTLDELGDLAPYPDDWNSGSWLIDIEYSISGLRYYLFKNGQNIPSSRSGPAIQVKSVVRGNQSFSRIGYISELFREFLIKINSI